MNVSRDRLSVIGKLIGIYREERRGNTQNSFTLKKFCEGICSINTLKNIEAGGLSRSEDVYIELLDKLDLKFGEFPVIDEALNKLIPRLYRAIEYYDIDDIEIITDRMNKVLDQVKSYIYYSEMYHLFKCVNNYYVNDVLIDDISAKRYNKLLEINVSSINDILKILIFAKEKLYSISDINDYTKLIERLQFEKSSFICIKMMYLHYYFIVGDYLKLKDLIYDLENEFRLRNNPVRLLDVYNYAVVMHGYTDCDVLNEYITKINHITDESIPSIKISEINMNIATTCHKRKMYEDALIYFRKALIGINESYLPCYIYMADCQNRLDLKVNITKVDKNEYEKYPLNIRLMYKYFTFKETSPAFVRQNFIMKKILPTLKDEVFIDIFRYELNKVVEETGQYKVLFTFNKQLQKN